MRKKCKKNKKKILETCVNVATAISRLLRTHTHTHTLAHRPAHYILSKNTSQYILLLLFIYYYIYIPKRVCVSIVDSLYTNILTLIYIHKCVASRLHEMADMDNHTEIARIRICIPNRFCKYFCVISFFPLFYFSYFRCI